jgi:hypothetical protein
MSTWRRVSIKEIPNQRELIQRSESVGMLWVDLWLLFLGAHRAPVDEETIRGVYEFAKWALTESNNDSIVSSTLCHFYEYLPTKPDVRARMSQFMTQEEVLGLANIFRYHLSPDEFREFMSDWMRSDGKHCGKRSFFIKN